MKTIEQLQEENEMLRGVIYEAYQMAGALNASEQALDNLLAAASGEPLSYETFLPHYSYEDLRDKENAELKAERDALAAQTCELLRVLIQLNEQAERALDFDIGNYHALKNASCAADNAIAATSQHHLAEIRAEAGRAGFIKGYDYASYGSHPEDYADQYADSILKGEVK